MLNITPYKLTAQPTRICKIFKSGDPSIPAELYDVKSSAPSLVGFPYPLPSKKSDYTCSLTVGNVSWYGATTGLTRYDPDADREDDIIMFFAADRDLPDNCVKALMADGDGIWVLTETGASFIEIRLITPDEKAQMLLEESKKYVCRRNMYSQKRLAVAGDITTAFKHGHSDNDGCFTAGFAIGEMFHYATLKREKGENDPETVSVRETATAACEACLLLMHVHGRGNGFVARTYLCADEPVPDDGFFFRKTGGKASLLDTTATRERDIVGYTIDASAKVPERLARHYTDLGYTDDDIIYKADTSSDEITLHFLHMLVAHDILGPVDPELDELIKLSIRGLMDHIIDHGYELWDFKDAPTTWAKWSSDYFKTAFGYVDACLNAAEVLMYHKVTMHILGEEAKYLDSYNALIERGYADLTEKHYDRMLQASIAMSLHPFEDIMYGDHMLAVSSFFGLCTLEKDPVLLEKYRNGFKSWRTSIAREYNPGYDFPFALSCPDEKLNMDMIAGWFYRFNVSRLAAGVSTTIRHDLPVYTHIAGYKEISSVLHPDEAFISKYDRNPLQCKNEDSGGLRCVESCYVYTFAYWIGRYYGFFE